MQRRILVVDDSPTQVEHLRLLLEQHGFRVDTAANGRQALARVQSAPPDLIISDVLMPEMDGFALCQQIKSDPASRQIPFVLLTVLNSPVDVLLGFERGADNFITKPFADDYLLQRVRRVFANVDLARRQRHRLESRVRVGDRQITVAADKEQIVELLVAILEDLNRVSGRLVESQRMVEEYLDRLNWIERTRRALEEDRCAFTLHFQPVLDLAANQIAYHEVLLRMVDEDGQVVLPGRFLAIAEQTGVIRQIDRWVIRQAIQLLAHHHRTGRPLRLSINLSGHSVADREVLNTIETALSITGVNPACLAFEITESALIANMDAGSEFITSLRARGCRVAVDDFGVGFTSFQYLKNLPVDLLKVDGSFIRDLSRQHVDRRLVKAMVEMAGALGIWTIAECVEEAETLQVVRDLGIDFAQGYHIGRPQETPE